LSGSQGTVTVPIWSSIWAELARVAMVGVLEGALALLEHAARSSVDETGCRREDELDGRLVVVG